MTFNLPFKSLPREIKEAIKNQDLKSFKEEIAKTKHGLKIVNSAKFHYQRASEQPALYA